MSNGETRPCPIFSEPAEVGSLLGNADYQSMVDNGLVWTRGEPSMLKNIFPMFSGGEPVGDWELFKGTSIRGLRCTKCNRIILEL
jgi:hypothetical protein